MLQRASIDLFNPLVPKAHNSEGQNLLFPLQIKSASQESYLAIFIFCTLGTNGLKEKIKAIFKTHPSKMYNIRVSNVD